MLALAEFCEVLCRDSPGKAKLPGPSALPFACDHTALRPIVLLLCSELLLVVGLRLASREWFGNRQHRSNPRTKAELPLAPFFSLAGGVGRPAFPIVSVASLPLFPASPRS